MPEIQFESITSPFASGEIVLLDMQPKGSYSFQDILSHPDLVNYSGPIFAADFAISSSPEVSEDMLMEGGMLLATRYTGIYNGQVRSINQIDHHDPHPSHQQNISATNLAIEYVRRFGYPNGKIVLSHYDCDSVCAAWILSGKIDPMYFPRIWYAAIAADHTGDRDMIADILQGLSDISSNVYKTGKPIGNMHTPDPAISFSILPHLLRGEAIEMLPAVVQEALAYRDRQRRRIEYYVSRIESDGTIRDE